MRISAGFADRNTDTQETHNEVAQTAQTEERARSKRTAQRPDSSMAAGPCTRRRSCHTSRSVRCRSDGSRSEVERETCWALAFGKTASRVFVEIGEDHLRDPAAVVVGPASLP